MQLLLASPRCAPMIVNGAFSGLTALRTLHRDIDSNFITHIAPGSFVGLTSLSTLYVCVCIQSQLSLRQHTGHCVLPRVVAAE
eukprot:m.103636 g.103636  ORF g.103636 m.103636 type:complete len:83 (-) comp14154_c0_seq8:302-550(-)